MLSKYLVIGTSWGQEKGKGRNWGSGSSDRFLFLDFKITADGDCTHEIGIHLLIGKKAMTNLDSLKSKEVTLPQRFL